MQIKNTACTENHPAVFPVPISFNFERQFVIKPNRFLVVAATVRFANLYTIYKGVN